MTVDASKDRQDARSVEALYLFSEMLFEHHRSSCYYCPLANSTNVRFREYVSSIVRDGPLSRKREQEKTYMKATESLELEHRKIARVAEACGVFADELRQGSKIPARVLHRLADFFRLYGEQYHHQEEMWLFGMLRQKGVPADTWPLAGLSRENDKLRVLVEQLNHAIALYSEADGSGTGPLVETLHALAEVYEDHIWKEDYLLLPMATKLLSDTDQQVLADTFHTIEGNFGQEAYRSVARLSAAIKSCPLCSIPHEQVA